MMALMPTRLTLSALWFFLVLFSYYVLKPVRDALATETRLFGPLYLATFLAVGAALRTSRVAQVAYSPTWAGQP